MMFISINPDWEGRLKYLEFVIVVPTGAEHLLKGGPLLGAHLGEFAAGDVHLTCGSSALATTRDTFLGLLRDTFLRVSTFGGTFG